jgi:hypothetical protein
MVVTILGILYVIFLAFSFGVMVLNGMWALFPKIQLEIDPILVCLLGLVGLSAVVNIFSLFISINFFVYGIIFFSSVFLLWYNYRSGFLRIVKFHFGEFKNPILVTIFIVFLAVIAVESGVTVRNYDTGLYHAQNVQWWNSFPAVPGLGNLHERLAFNSSWFSLESLFSFPFIFQDPLHLVDPFLRLSLFLFFLINAGRLLTQKRNNSAVFALVFLTAFPVFLYCGSLSLANDVPAALFSWLVFYLFLEKANGDHQPQWDLRSVEITMFSTYLVMIKVSTAPIMILPAYLILTELIGKSNRDFIKIFLLIGFLIVPWLAQNFILSGYLVYPIAVTRLFHPDWQIPVDSAVNMEKVIISWARIPWVDYKNVISLPMKSWFPVWLFSQQRFKLFIILWGVGVNFLLVLSDICHRWKCSDFKNPYKNDLSVLRIAGLLGLFYWLFTAPDIRFGLAFILPTFGLSFIRNFPNHQFEWPGPNLRKPIFLFFFPLLFCVLLICVDISQIGIGKWSFIRQAAYPKAHIQSIDVGDSLVVNVPLGSDQCWNTAAPCTPLIVSGLSLRGSSISSGFKIHQNKIAIGK